MNTCVYFCLASILIAITDAYVFLQVNRNENQSDVDELIHKIIPKTIEDSKRISRRNSKTNLQDQFEHLESLVLAVHTGVKSSEPIKPNLAQNVQHFVKNIIENENVKAFFRSNKGSYNNIKPEIVHFKSDKPSLMVELSFDSIIDGIDEILRSKKAKDYADTLGHHAALIYRTLLDESRKDG